MSASIFGWNIDKVENSFRERETKQLMPIVSEDELLSADVFEEYFRQMLDLIIPGPVIVMDNVNYNHRSFNDWRRADIIQWLSEKKLLDFD